MELGQAGASTFTLTLGAAELSALIAAARLAAEVLQRDERAPAQALAQVRALLRDYDAAVAALDEADGR